MRPLAWSPMGIIAAGMAAFLGHPCFAQDQASPERDAQVCSAADQDFDARVQACTLVLEREARDAARRKAIALTNRGRAWKGKGETERAVADFTAAIEADPSFVYAYADRGDLFREKNQCEQAITNFDQVIRLVPQLSATYVSRSICRIENRDYEQAIADLDAAIRLDPNNAGGIAVMALSMKGGIESLRGDFDRAIAAYDEAIKLEPKRASPYNDRGSAWSSKGDDERALADYDQAIALDPSNAEGAARLASSLKARLTYGKGDTDRAIAEFGEAIRVDPKRALSYIDRAYAWSSKGDHDHALADCDEAIRLDANNADNAAALAWSLKARLHAAKGDLDGAVADDDEAIKLNPKRASLYLDRGNVWASKRDYNRALADLEQAARLDPDNVEGVAALALNMKGRIEQLRGDLDRAVADYGEVIRFVPNDPAPYIGRGDAYRAKGEHGLAVQDYSRAIELKPDEVPAYAGRGLARFYLGDFAKAADDLDRGEQGQAANAYSMLWLYLARARAGKKTAKEELTKTAGELNQSSWPYPIVELFLERRSPEAIQAAGTKRDEQCEALFYIGQWQLLRGARAPARKAFRTAVDTCPKDFVEYRGAMDELKRLK